MILVPKICVYGCGKEILFKTKGEKGSTGFFEIDRNYDLTENKPTLTVTSTEHTYNRCKSLLRKQGMSNDEIEHRFKTVATSIKNR